MLKFTRVDRIYPFYLHYLKTALAGSVLLLTPHILSSGWASSVQNHNHIQNNAPYDGVVLDPVTIISSSSYLPFEVVKNPKNPQQPIPASDGADYLKTIPGFASIRNGGTNGDPVFRGMFGSRLNIVNDGGVILGACPGRMDNPTSYISPESYDKLTIIKGPQTVKWGPTGSAATILFEREPRHFDKSTIVGNSSVVFGTDKRISAIFDGTVGGRLGYARIIANKTSAADYRDGKGNTVPSKWNKWNGDLFMGWTPDADTLIEISGGGGDGESRYAGRGMDGTQFKRETLGAKFVKENINDVLTKIDGQLYYNYADHIMDNFRLRQLRPQINTMGNMNSRPMAGMMNMSAMPMESRVDRRTYGGRLAATWQFADIELVTGFDAQASIHRKRNRVNMMTVSGWDKDAVFNNYGLYSELTWSISDANRVVGGVRVDWVGVKDERWASLTKGQERKATLPSAFIRYEQDMENIPLTSYIGIGYTQRFPDYWELFSPKRTDNSLNAFAGIEAEKTTQIDFGAQYATDQSNIWFSGYIGKVTDYILFDYSMGSSKASIIDATILGGEAGISRSFLNYWRIDTSVAYSWGKDTTNDEALPQIPPLEGRIGLSYEQENWSIGSLWRLVAKQTRIAPFKGNVVGQDYAESSAFGILSLNGSYKFSRALRLTGGIDNFFNKEYSEHLNRDGDAGFGFPARYQLREPGRTFWAKMDFTF